ncbi:MAG: GTP-binding protein [Candidatus Heimdallarchaeota archaeon]|nr:GTP-binding protein [Candidatus Heimdallarchaeota archaeon]
MGLFKALNKGNEPKITFVGPSQSGKTTLVRFLESGNPVIEDPYMTLGFDVRQNFVLIEGVKVAAIDLGGQVQFQQIYWEEAVLESNAVIFVLDATLKKEIEEHRYMEAQRQFEYVLDIIPDEIPMMILLNKQDLVELSPMKAAEIKDFIQLNSLKQRKFGIFEGSAKFGNGIIEAIEWLVEGITYT